MFCVSFFKIKNFLLRNNASNMLHVIIQYTKVLTEQDLTPK